MTSTVNVPQRVSEVLDTARSWPPQERLLLAKLLLDSLVLDESEDDADWQGLALAPFERDWDNPDDAIYDNWRGLYGVQPR